LVIAFHIGPFVLKKQAAVKAGKSFAAWLRHELDKAAKDRRPFQFDFMA
jgi:hypothetical protein